MKQLGVLISGILIILLTGCRSGVKNDNAAGISSTPAPSLNDQTQNIMHNNPNPADPEDFKQIDSLIAINQIKTAEKQLEVLIERYEKNNVWDGYVRAVMTMTRIKAQNEEGQKDAVDYLEDAIRKASFPAQQILYSVAARTYLSYLDANMYRLRSVTDGEGLSEEGDFETWSAPKILQKAEDYYFKSIENEDLKNIPVGNINLITTQSNTDIFRPSLYDFLTHEILDYLSNDRNYIDQPVYKFEIRGAEWFDDYQVFANRELTARDSTSRVFRSLELFQQLIRYHEEAGNKEALRHVDLERLNFVYNHSVDVNKTAQFASALEKITGSGNKEEWKAEYELRSIELELQNDRYSPENPDQGNRYLLNEITEKLSRLAADYPDSNVAIKARNRIASIHAPALNLQGESLQIPGKPFLLLATYANLTGTEIYVYKLDREEFLNYNNYSYRKEFLRRLGNKPIFRTINITLPDFKDHRQHKVELKADALDNGFYLFSHQHISSQDDYYNSFAVIQVSNLAVMENSNMSAKNNIKAIVDRTSGQPLKDVAVQVYSYDYNTRVNNKIAQLTSDNNGFVRFDIPENRSFISIYEKGNDMLIDLRNSYLYRNDYQRDRSVRANFFTDRAIYRPGQIVYFKAILYKNDDNDLPSVVRSRKVTVSLRDVNDQEVAKSVLTTNEYGSIHGNFTVPSGVLTGQMSLYFDGQWGKGIQVEEYKRPKFEVKMDTVRDAYVLKDRVKLSGKALNYAGNPVDGAQVVYTITRTQSWRYPVWDYGYFKPYMPSNEMIIANGSLVTDQDGAFSVEFDAIPDESINPESKPRFNYTITADVTDINGETQTGSQSVLLSYDRYQTGFNVSGKIGPDELRSLVVDTKNSAGVSVPVSGRLIIERLVAPTGYLRRKLYPYPEEVTVPKEEYKKLWPYESYLNELDRTTWKTAETVFDEKIKSGPDPQPALKKVNFAKGEYRIRFDADGNAPLSARQAHYVTVKDKNIATDFETDRLINSFNNKEKYQPGETAVQTMASRNPSGKLLYEFYVKGKLVEKEWLSATAGIQKSRRIEEQYRGGVNTVVTAFGYGRIESVSNRFDVPWSNKDLQITLKTFRDKLQPGQQETWEMVVSGPGKDKVMAEVLASMYDASLDVFAQDNYNRIAFPYYYSDYTYSDPHNTAFNLAKNFNASYEAEKPLIWRTYRSDLLVAWYYYRRMYKSANVPAPTLALESVSADGVMAEAKKMESGAQVNQAAGAENEVADDQRQAAGKEDKAGQSGNPPSVRTNLEETVFFYPDLYTDKNGDVVLRFTMKEALTRWKLRLFAHTRELQQGSLEKEITTSKDLMVFPNLPRYFRENDEIELTAKVSNLNGLGGVARAKLELLDAISMQPLPAALIISSSEQDFSLSAGQSSVVRWKIKSPSLPTEAVVVRITASTAQHSDGEENTLPVLSNRMMVTETMPMMIRKGQEKTFTFESMLTAGKSNTATPYRYTVEYSSNPAWYAVQALPYLMEYPYECTEQLLNRYYANSLASYVANSNPRIKAVFEKWKNTDALLSNLQKNEELKSALLQETPWVLQAQSEEQQKKNIGLLFDLNKMANEQSSALRKILERQYQSGGLPWFPGCRENEYVTSYVVENIGHLMHLGVLKDTDGNIAPFVERATGFCDQALEDHYTEIKKITKNVPGQLEEDHLYYWPIQYLYARSFIKNADQGFTRSEAYQYFFDQSKKYWNKKNHYAQGMIALYLSRGGEKNVPGLIVEGLRQTAYRNDQIGMYWNAPRGYFWYELPIESQALMIEVFSELTKDQDSIDEMKIWLLLNKQTNSWNTTKGTSAAIYALLLNGGAMNLETVYPAMEIGGKRLDIAALKPEAGTGYFKTSYSGKDIKPEMSAIKVKNNAQVVNWGGAYYQYYEQMDKIQSFKATPLTIEKSYNIVHKGDRGETMTPVGPGQKIKVGDKIRVRTIIRVDRPMEFVHLKDMRPAGTEPLNTISGYRYKNGLGYYESTKDVATHFFMDYLPKGTYVFEYDIRASLKGDFSTGISTIQCMYAPEFSSHGKGERMKIE